MTGTPSSLGPRGNTESPARDQNAAPVDVRKPSGPFLFYATGVVLVAVIALIAIVWWNAAHEDDSPPERVCQDFITRRRAGDPATAALLGRVPARPAGELTETEAERLQTDFFLHDPGLTIIKLRPAGPEEKGVPPLVFVTKGNVSAPRLEIRLKDGELSSQQRTMSNPDLYVEVRDGKIYGVRATLPRD